jgi:pimeloyl-ACP methyl ester carboxylesterase
VAPFVRGYAPTAVAADGCHLHGDRDGCVDVALVADAERHLAPGSRMDIIQGVGHFPHLEWAVVVNERILAWVGQQ